MPQIINVNGQRYEIENWDEFSQTLLNAIGLQVESEITKEINKLRLVNTGRFKQSTSFEVNGNELTISNFAPYAAYLEYGTYDYFGRFGVDSFPQNPDPKKKSLGKTAREALPKGMQPFAPFRRVLFNKKKMENIVERAAKLASR